MDFIKLKTGLEKDISKSVKKANSDWERIFEIMYGTKVSCTGYIKNCQNSTARKQTIEVLNR